MTFPSALSQLLANKNQFLSRYVKRRHWWFVVELPLTPNSVYDDIKPSNHNPDETDLTIKFIDSLSNSGIHPLHHLVRAYTKGNYVYGYIHYPNSNVSKWKAAYDLKLFPRCIISEAPTAHLKTLLKKEKTAMSPSSVSHLQSVLTSTIYKTIHDTLGYSTGIDPDKLISKMTHWHITTLETKIKNSTTITIPPPTNNTPSHKSREQKWEIIFNQPHRHTTG
jgi:hypothetical protein